MAQELVCGYHRANLSPRCALKFDLRKAFDSLDWSFIFNLLKALEYPDQFINWVKACISTPKFSITVNGGLAGYFNGAKGVRQGDPISPYIFVLAINVLSKLLDAAVEYGVCSYHPKCKKIKLTHLCFADDLLVFTKGSYESIMGVKNLLQFFYTCSGLQMNCSKSEIYCAGIRTEDLEEVISATGFTVGKLPVKYLGVPLVAKGLSDRDCKPLVDKILGRISSWTAKYLSFAGRMQLIKSVLFSIGNFWCQNFLLPQSIIKQIIKACSSYFWKGKEGSSKGARVSWDTICHPKSEGGLGMKDLKLWNRCCVLRNLWTIFVQAGSFWVAWIQAYVLKGRQVMEIPILQRYSWNLKKVLKLRELASRFIQSDGTWCMQSPKFKVGATYEKLRQKEIKVAWHRVLWFKYHIPKHTIIFWMAILDRLPTRNRLVT